MTASPQGRVPLHLPALHLSHKTCRGKSSHFTIALKRLERNPDNLIIRGQQHTEPFISIEAQIAAFCSQAYLFDADIEKELAKIERELRNNGSDTEYKKGLDALGIKPKAQLAFTIPEEAQQVALETLFEFTENTKLEYAYQMLLLLVMLKWADENGQFSLKYVMSS
jgi:hypothetical protein